VFEPAEIDLLVQSTEEPEATDSADTFHLPVGPAVSRLSDLWILGPHHLYCGSALEVVAYDALFKGDKATAAFTDPPYNVPIDSHAVNKRRTGTP